MFAWETCQGVWKEHCFGGLRVAWLPSFLIGLSMGAGITKVRTGSEGRSAIGVA